MIFRQIKRWIFAIVLTIVSLSFLDLFATIYLLEFPNIEEINPILNEVIKLGDNSGLIVFKSFLTIFFGVTAYFYLKDKKGKQSKNKLFKIFLVVLFILLIYTFVVFYQGFLIFFIA